MIGGYSQNEARARILDVLNETGYAAPEGLEGTIKDLRSDQRLEVMIKTNVEMARGWSQNEQMKGSLLYPGKRLFRPASSNPEHPRDWHEKWQTAASAVGYKGVAPGGEMIALSDSPVWTALSAFGNPYPPFDFNSGMEVDFVDYDTCREIGLITDDNEDEVLDRIEEQRPTSLNEGLEAQRDYREQDLRDSISENLKGLAHWEGNTLKFNDPNGTLPYDWREVGSIINAELPEGIPNLQADALRDWVNDHTAFEGNVKLEGKAGWDEREDFTMLVDRIKPVSSQALDTTLYRGMTVENKILAHWLDTDTYTTKPGKLVDSWAVTPGAANKYTKQKVNTNERHNVILIMDDYSDVRPIHAAVREVGGIKSPNPAQILETDGEVLTVPSYDYQILKKKTDPKTGLVTLNVKQKRRKRP